MRSLISDMDLRSLEARLFNVKVTPFNFSQILRNKLLLADMCEVHVYARLLPCDARSSLKFESHSWHKRRHSFMAPWV